MAVRTQRLAGAFSATTVAANIFTCPVGRTAVVRSVFYVNVAGASSTLTLSIDPGTGTFGGLHIVVLGNGTSGALSTGFVMNPGDILRGVATVNSIRVWVFGSLLAGAPE